MAALALAFANCIAWLPKGSLCLSQLQADQQSGAPRNRDALDASNLNLEARSANYEMLSHPFAWPDLTVPVVGRVNWIFPALPQASFTLESASFRLE
jgi:hypothetical protein